MHENLFDALEATLEAASLYENNIKKTAQLRLGAPGQVPGPQHLDSVMVFNLKLKALGSSVECLMGNLTYSLTGCALDAGVDCSSVSLEVG